MDNLSLEVEFPIDNDRLKRESAESKKIISGVGETAATTAERAEKRMVDAFDKPRVKVGDLERSLMSLKIQVQHYEAIVEKSFDSKIIAEFNRKIDETKNQIAYLKGLGRDALIPMEQGAMKTKSNFNGLQNSINQISRELPAFTYSAQTGFMGISNNIPILADEIARLRHHNDELVASGQKGVPIWKQLVTGLFSWGTALSLGVTLMTIYGKEIGNFISSLFKGSAAIDAVKERLKALNETLKGTDYQKAVSGMMELRINLDLAKKGMVDKEAVVKQYNETIGKTAGQVSNLDDVEKGMIANADNYIKMTLYKAAANLQLAEAAKNAAQIQENSNKKAEEFANFGDQLVSSIAAGGGGAGSQFGVGKFDQKQYEQQLKDDGEKRRIAENKQLEEDQKAYEKNANDLLIKAAEFADKMGGKLLGDSSNKNKDKTDKKEANAMAQALERREDLLNKLADLDAEYSRKSFDKDKEELQALKDKFAKARRIIEDFNNNPNNSKVAKVDVNQLAPIEAQAERDLIYRQDTDKLKIELAKQKELFEEYEDWKTKVGQAKADERFKKDLNGFKNFKELIESKSSNQPLDISSGVFQEREKFINDTLKGVSQKDNKTLLGMLEKFSSYNQERLKIIENAEIAIKELVLKGENEAAEQARKIRAQNLLKLDEDYLKSQDSIKDILENLDTMTDEAAKNALKSAQSFFDNFIKNSELTAEEAEKLSKIFGKVFKSVDQTITSKSLHRYSALGDELRQIAGEVGNVNAQFGDMLGILGNVIVSVGNVKEQIENIKKAKASGDLLGGITAGLGIAGAMFSVANTVSSMLDQKREERNQKAEAQRDYQNELQLKQTEAVTKALERQLAIIEQLYGSERLEKYAASLKDISKQYGDVSKTLSKQFTMTGDKNIDKNLERLNKGESIDSIIDSYKRQSDDYYIANIIKKNIKKGNFNTVGYIIKDIKQANEEIERLQRLADSGKLDANSQAILTKLKNQVSLYNEAFNALREETTGTTVSAITSDLVSIFENGEDALESFEKKFKDTMQQALLQSLERDFLKDKVQSWYENFHTAIESDSELTAAEVAQLQKDYLKIGNESKAYYDQLKKATGLDFTKETDASEKTMAGAIKGITADQADLLAGQFGGLRISMIELVGVSRDGYASIRSTAEGQLDILRSSYITQMQIEQNTRRTADNTEKLLSVDASLKSIDKKMDSNDANLRAAGLKP
jgi:hypothetical protein